MINDPWIAIADVHLGWKLFNLPELAQDLKDTFIKAVNVAIQKKVKRLFIVGDLYDNNKPSPDLVKFVVEQVTRLNANGIIVQGIAGDHDKPINNSSWAHLSGILPLSASTGPYVGFDYSDNSQDNIDKLAAMDVKAKKLVEWIFLHGQVPELFSFTEDKKKLDIKSLDVFNNFPNLKGIVLGDIHTAISGLIEDPTQTASPIWIGYCGALGVIKTDEIGKKEGILYYNGDELTRIPIELERKFIRLNLADSLKPINWIEKYTRFFKEHTGKKPVFVVEHDRDTKALLPEIAPLYEIGIVKVLVSKKKGDTKEETINLRSELKTNNRIEAALKECAQEKEVYDLLLGILQSDDPKTTLDKFKETTLTEK